MEGQIARRSEQIARFPFLAMAPWESVPSAREVVAQLQADSTGFRGLLGLGFVGSSCSGKRRRIIHNFVQFSESGDQVNIRHLCSLNDSETVSLKLLD